MSAKELSELRKLRALSTDGNEKLDKIMHQNRVLISLLGRLAFTPKDIQDIVKKKKRNPQKYIEGYNACDGTLTITQLAKIIGVDLSTLSPILAGWEELGIIYEVVKPNGKFYKKLFPI